MRYYLLNLAMHALILIALILLACVFTLRNRKRKTKSVIGYFLPSLFAVLAILDLAIITAPRLIATGNVQFFRNL